MTRLRSLTVALVSALALCTFAARADTTPETAIERMLATPIISTEPGFKATVVAPPGHMYDPLTMEPCGRGRHPRARATACRGGRGRTQSRHCARRST